MGPEKILKHGTGTVYLRAIQEGSQVVDLLPGIAGVRAGCRIELGTVHGDGRRASRFLVKEGVAGGHRNVERLGRVGRDTSHVMVDELPPHITVIREVPAIGYVNRLGKELVAEQAGAGPVSPGRGGNAVAVGGGLLADQLGEP